jgi:hypothetical protein
MSLDGLRVLEVSEGVAGAYAGKLLRDQGAEVKKLATSTRLRRWSAATPDEPVDGVGPLASFLDRGKELLSIPGGTPTGGRTSSRSRVRRRGSSTCPPSARRRRSCASSRSAPRDRSPVSGRRSSPCRPGAG